MRIAEFGGALFLLATTLGCVRRAPEKVGMGVGLCITAGYWFTASTSFANPAVTIVRSFTDTFAGIAASDAVPFIAMQIVGAFFTFSSLSFLMRLKRPKLGV